MSCLGVQVGPGGSRTVPLAGVGPAAARDGFPASLAVCLSDGRRRGAANPRICAVATTWAGDGVETSLGLASVDRCGDMIGFKKIGGRDQTKKLAIVPQLDRLMKESVAEIVKNINEAPFLVHVYSSEEDSSSRPTPSTNNPSKVIIEKASSDNWPFIKQRWEDGNSTIPDGVILVEELDENMSDNSSNVKEEMMGSSSSSSSSSPSSTKFWGLLVQGRGVSCPSCYILKTSQVECCFGFSTHFCLAKAECLAKGADFLFTKMWLQR